MLLRAHARPSRPPCEAPRGAGDRLRRKRPQRRVRAPRPLPAVRRGPRDARSRPGPDALGADGADARSHVGARRRRAPPRSAACGSRSTTPSSRRCVASTRRFATTASRPSGSIPSRSGSDALFAGGFVHPGDGALDPALWVRRLAQHAAEAGAEIVERRPVEPDELDRLEAAAVVLAVDGMTDALAPELRPFVTPMRGQVLATEPLELLYDRPHYARGGYDYWQQLPDGRLILGGRRDTSLETERTAADETTAAIQGQLDAFAEQLFGRKPRDHSPLVRVLGPDGRPAPARGAAARQRPGLGRRRLLRATATSSASSAATWSPRRSSASRRPSSPRSTLPGRSRRGPAAPSRRPPERPPTPQRAWASPRRSCRPS